LNHLKFNEPSGEILRTQGWIAIRAILGLPGWELLQAGGGDLEWLSVTDCRLCPICDGPRQHTTSATADKDPIPRGARHPSLSHPCTHPTTLCVIRDFLGTYSKRGLYTSILFCHNQWDNRAPWSSVSFSFSDVSPV